jgi:Stage II sporulation protein E (SpoIIE)
MPPRKPAKPETKFRSFINLLWIQALSAIPFGIFFGTLFGGGLRGYIDAYFISLVFAYVIGLSVWATEAFIRPRLLPESETPAPGGFIKHGLLFGGVSLAASFVAAMIIHYTLLPGFMGSPRQVLTIAMFSVLFVVLVSGIIYAVIFYKEAVQRARSDQELDLARRIQRSFLLSQFPSMPRLEVHAVNVSSKQVSGDFYDVVPAGPDAFYVVIADVSGKGVPAALLTSMLQASLRTQADMAPSVAAVATRLNGLVHSRSSSSGQFATCFLGRVDESTLRMVYTNAGHNYPVVFRADGGREELERGGLVVGFLEGVPYEEGSVQLAPGDRVVFYTDGISEAENATGEMYGEERLYALIESLPRELAARDVIERVLHGVRDFLDGVEPADDMTIMVLRVLPSRTP